MAVDVFLRFMVLDEKFNIEVLSISFLYEVMIFKQTIAQSNLTVLALLGY